MVSLYFFKAGLIYVSPGIVTQSLSSLSYDIGTSHLRAGFASHTQPYINEPNQAAKFTSRKSVRTVMYGRDCEADNTAKGYIKPIFDGDILLTNELLVSTTLLGEQPHSRSLTTSNL